MTERIKLKYFQKILPQCYLVLQKFNMNCPGIKPGSPHCEAGIEYENPQLRFLWGPMDLNNKRTKILDRSNLSLK
jgi:hypothetical protein